MGKPIGKIAGSALTTRQFVLLFSAMLVTATGNTALQSVMPSIGRSLGIADVWIGVAFTSSALAWVIFAPIWARQSDHRGRKTLILLGLVGFVVSTLLCGIVLLGGLRGVMGAGVTMVAFALVRMLYGIFGCATPAGTQAYLAAKTRRGARTTALSNLSASFGLGTVIGPALAPLFVLPFLGLTGPLFMFALAGMLVFAAVWLQLPDDRDRLRRAKAAAMAFPAASPTGASVRAATSEGKATLRWSDSRIRDWIVSGAITNNALAALLTVVGFHTIDRLALDPVGAEQQVGLVLMAGAAATLVAQWGLIPRFGWGPRTLVLLGSAIALAGTLAVMVAGSLMGLVLAYGLACLGFGLTRPGFTAGASLAVPLTEQGAVAGLTTSVNGFAFVFAPTLGLALYGFAPSAPFLLCAGLLGATLLLYRGRL
ncbi:MFS transporter [Sphingomicrobium sp. B8]|uniref:MFS transporter n=2 Tax=Sphingomicrobium clamense TaxID=2851013 RepID=A0ABS6V440_9SPHN|nr:MFS transporter [Sphingomicrobium sp. B8]